MSEKAPREILADKVVKLIFEISDIIDEHVKDDDAADDLTGKIHRYADLSGYIQYSTDDELEARYFQETEVWPECPITGYDENNSEFSLKQLCPLTYCDEYDTCWAAKSLTEPVNSEYGGYPDE